LIELAMALKDKNGASAERAAVVLASVFSNTSSQITVHVVHDEGLSKNSQQKLAALVNRYVQTIVFHPVKLPNVLLEAEAAGRYTHNILTTDSIYRMLLPTVLPADKAIYLDCGVTVNMDIAELWNIDLGSCYLGAVRGRGILDDARDLTMCGLDPEAYFHSGILLLSLRNIRQNTAWHEQMLSYLRTLPQTALSDPNPKKVYLAGLEPYQDAASPVPHKKAWFSPAPWHKKTKRVKPFSFKSKTARKLAGKKPLIFKSIWGPEKLPVPAGRKQTTKTGAHSIVIPAALPLTNTGKTKPVRKPKSHEKTSQNRALASELFGCFAESLEINKSKKSRKQQHYAASSVWINPGIHGLLPVKPTASREKGKSDGCLCDSVAVRAPHTKEQSRSLRKSGSGLLRIERRLRLGL